jgi:DNA polymerase-3 subunit delta
MPRPVTPDRLAASLGKAVAPAYYLHGSETLLKDEATATLVATLLDPSLRDFDLDHASAREVAPDRLAGLCATLPMMADRRVVVLRDVEAWKRKSKAKLAAVEYLQRPAPDTVLVMVQGDDKDPDGDLASHAVAVDCRAPVGEALDAWLDARLAGAGVALTPDAREHLLRATSGDMGLLGAECAKLAGLGGGDPVDRETVAALVGVRHGETVDDWRDAVLRDDLGRATALLPGVLGQGGVSGVRLAFTLGASLLALGWIRAVARDRRLRGGALLPIIMRECLYPNRPLVGDYQSFARTAVDVVADWPLARIRAGVRAVLASDVALKSTTISSEEGILTDLVLQLATSKNRKAA